MGSALARGFCPNRNCIWLQPPLAVGVQTLCLPCWKRASILPPSERETACYNPDACCAILVIGVFIPNSAASVFSSALHALHWFPKAKNGKCSWRQKNFIKIFWDGQKASRLLNRVAVRCALIVAFSCIPQTVRAGWPEGGQSPKGGKENVAKFDVCVLITVGRGEKACPGSNGFGIIFLQLASRKFQVFHEYHRHSTHAFCPFLYKTTLSIRSLIFCSPFSVIIYPSLLINRGLKAVCTLDRNKKYITHKQVNGFYKPNSSISFFTSSFFSSERLWLSLISSIARFLPPQNIILHHLRTW